MNGLRKLPDARAVLFFTEEIGFSEFQMGAKSPVFVRGSAELCFPTFRINALCERRSFAKQPKTGAHVKELFDEVRFHFPAQANRAPSKRAVRAGLCSHRVFSCEAGGAVHGDAERYVRKPGGVETWLPASKRPSR